MNVFKYSARNLTSVQKLGIIPFVTTYHPAVKNLKQLLMQEWSLTHNQPMLKNIYKTPPIILYRRRKSLRHTRLSKTLKAHITASQPQRHLGKSEQVCHDLFSTELKLCKISYEIRFFPVRVFAAAMFNFLGNMKHR